MMTKKNSPPSCDIHPTAIVSTNAILGEGVKIGPYCVIGPQVTLGDRVVIHSHVVIDNVICDISEGVQIFPFVSINVPQDLKYNGEPSKVKIGAHTMLREYVTVQPGTAADKMETVIGHHCLLMASAHVAHDCILGNYVQMANNATLAGHVTVGDYAIIGGLAAVHQFVNIGPYAIVGGMSGVTHDVIPYGNVKGDRAFLNGLNIIGLKRRGFTREQMEILRRVYDQLFTKEGTLADRVSQLQNAYGGDPEIRLLLDFVARETTRPLMMPAS